MGLFGFGSFFGNIVEFIEDSASLATELVQVLDDGRKELHEICTDGFNEMVIKGNSNYKTSFEIKEEAENKIRTAERKYERRRKEFDTYLNDLNNKINDLYKKKVEIAKLLNQTVKRMPNMPRVTGYVVSPSYSYTPSTISMLFNYSDFDIRGRKDSAKEYLEEAKDFQVEVNAKIAELNRVEAFLNTIKISLEEEEELINALGDSLNMRRRLPYNKVAEQLHILISEYVLDKNGKKNEKYMEAINQLRRIS